MSTNLAASAPLQALQQYFGYPNFRPGQEQIVSSVVSGRDALAVLPTGGGKSICYQVPALLLPRVTVVISPLISLMDDQVSALKRRGIAADFINSTISPTLVAERLAQARSGALKLLYVAPERFDQGLTAQRLRSAGVSLLAIDEAHCISEWGHDFRPSYMRLNKVREELGNPPVIALTATATPRVQRDIISSLKLDRPVIVVTGFDRTNLSYSVQHLDDRDEKDTALLQLVRSTSDVCIVYAPTRKSVERVASMLNKHKVNAGAYHAGMHEKRRAAVQALFMSGKVRVLVATNAFGMGIDKPNVRLVVHHAMPGTLEAYYQEAGRAGRDGKPSTCILLHSYSDRFTHEFFIRIRIPESDSIHRVFRALHEARDNDFFVPLSWSRSGGLLVLKLHDAELRACIGFLEGRGALRVIPPSTTEFTVRILATPDRITSELLGSGRKRIRRVELLRELWRRTVLRTNPESIVNIGDLRRKFPNRMALRSLLTSLQNEQFIFVEPVGGGWQLDRRFGSDSTFDTRQLDRRRVAEMEKLRSMEQYAYAESCRRAFLLRYFGDKSAAENCGGCDNCLEPVELISSHLNSATSAHKRNRSLQVRFRFPSITRKRK